ncbi:DUF596 domain-containing protein [bacterium]|nr:MAG: DUF596 domain-containing protein [bacterium]
MFEEKYTQNILRCDMGHSIAALWDWSRDYPPFAGDLDLAKKGFFYLAERFMRQGILKLANNGIIWEGCIEDQLKRFEATWPKEYDKNDEEKDIDNLWWYTFAPDGAVWVYPDGNLVWT